MTACGNSQRSVSKARLARLAQLGHKVLSANQAFKVIRVSPEASGRQAPLALQGSSGQLERKVRKA